MAEYFCVFRDFYTGASCTIDPEWEVFYENTPDQVLHSCDIHLHRVVPSSYPGQVWIKKIGE